MRARILIPAGLVVLGALAVANADRLEQFVRGGTGMGAQNLAGGDMTATIADVHTILAQADGGTATPLSARPTAQPKVDETALRYFAARGDTKRLEAEIARLKALYPNWVPPQNPLAAAPVGDPQLDAMWKLYSDGKLAELEKAIAARQLAEPGWTPPPDLVDRLKLAEAREQLVKAADLKNYDEVVRLGAANTGLLTCGDVDVLWRVAEAFARTDRKDRATDAYLYVLRNCDKPEERLGSVQKALPLLPRSDIALLLALERKAPDGKGEFEPVRADIARQSLADAGKDPKLTVLPEDLALVEKLANDQNLVSDNLLLGWYHLRRDNPQGAETWFRRAYLKESSAETAQGLALSLVDTNRAAEAETVLFQWRDSSDDTKKVYLAAVANLLAANPPPQPTPEVLDRMSRAVVAAKDPVSAQQFGWYADALNQFQTAGQWFALALGWKPDDEPNAYGLALMRWKLGDKAGVREMQRAWAGRSERIARVGEPEAKPRNGTPTAPLPPLAPTQPRVEPQARAPVAVSPTQEAAPERRARPRRAAAQPRNCQATQDPTGMAPEQALSRGWCLMEINRPLEAAAAFEVALRGSGRTRSDAAYGQSLAYLRAGLADRAAVASTKAPLSGGRATEIRTALLEQQALAAFEHGRYRETLMTLEERARIAPERINLMILRGYAYLKLRRFSDAEQVFRAAAATGDRDALKALGDLARARNPN
ncbi:MULTISPECIES: hypothetical protein [Phyllobacteriaceae]|jgi:cellulose synthase operon protein C|uniref:Uncharacterized protein n=3 Tax=Pseudomonadota TaxID=1224 RepID=A0A1C2DIM0_9HYPH|nr:MULTISPECIES: hypothetical protein [Mesorhizobium]MBN9234423.1 cellulose synthase [Mesorhizobium sp.]MDQ0332488.1 tetratricopeptide (TPR) repeat protein [Mesorhizobium sp. YL-MeA3-2017]OCX14496.1 hypothetical protein QV13_18690 [Mesorhizobium hungaricum]